MSAFSTWAHRLKDHLSNCGIQIALGQAQELLASGLGHNTLASFNRADLAALRTAHRIVICPELMYARAVALRLDATAEDCWRFVQAINRGDRAERRITTEDMMALAARVVLMDSAHDLKDQFAREMNGQRENTDCHDVSERSTLDRADGVWEWVVRGAVRCVTADTAWEAQVEGLVVFPKIGRRLLAEGALVSLTQVGAPVEYDWDPDHGDVYWHDQSD